jgi:hypothetical protein
VASPMLSAVRSVAASLHALDVLVRHYDHEGVSDGEHVVEVFVQPVALDLVPCVRARRVQRRGRGGGGGGGVSAGG